MSAVGGIASQLPNPFGGFAPFPNSIMIPFMGAQSAVLGYQFGMNYEMGKRTIKAMDNDLFNKIVSGSGSELEGGQITVNFEGKEYKLDNFSEYPPLLMRLQWEKQITEFRNAIPHAQSLMNDVIEESVKIELKKAERTPSAMAEIINALGLGTSEALKDAGLTAEEVDTYTAFIASIYGLPLSIVSAFLNYTPPTEPTDPEVPLWYDPHTPSTEGTNHDVTKIFSLQIQDPIAGFTRTYYTCNHDWAGHITALQVINSAYTAGGSQTDCNGNSFSGTAMSHVINAYKDAINNFYYNNIV